MKRFYCKTCKKIKRARNFPSQVLFSLTNIPKNITDRIAVCDFHITATNYFVKNARAK